MGKKKTVHRSSVTGQFVTEGYAKKHPKTTERERVNVGGKEEKQKKGK